MAKRNELNIARLISQEMNEVPIGSSFVDDLNHTIYEMNKKNSKPSMTYKPSSMHCIRNMYYQVTGCELDDEQPMQPDMCCVCDSGTDRHMRIQSYIKHMKDYGVDCEFISVADYVKNNHLDYLDIVSFNEYETKLHDNRYNITLMCDGLIKYKGKYYLFEFKTETMNKYSMRKAVDKNHYLQATAYSNSMKINDVIFVYECRDFCSKKGFLFTVTDEMRSNLVNKILECDSHIKNNTIPDKPEIDRKYCNYCSYRKSCRMEDLK